ncbi:hypothetical protein EJB05_29339, partial [Eragrostis curvula]
LDSLTASARCRLSLVETSSIASAPHTQASAPDACRSKTARKALYEKKARMRFRELLSHHDNRPANDAASCRALSGDRLVTRDVTTTVLVSGAVRSTEPGVNETVHGCPTSCGNLTFAYPFGIGSECSRGPDFQLTCDDAAWPPKLFLRDNITEVIESVDVVDSDDGNNYYNSENSIRASIWRAIPMKSGVRVYNLTLEPPGRSFSLGPISLNITGCDLSVYYYSVDEMGGRIKRTCSTSCPPGEEITEMAARTNCYGVGCCQVDIYDDGNDSYLLSFVHDDHNKRSIGTSSRSNRTSLLWDRITVTSDGGVDLTWTIIDPPNCLAASGNQTSYACKSRNAYCSNFGTDGYLCYCDKGYTGNPYIVDGCINDRGYNPNQTRADCTRQCGNVSVQFPFGLEMGCFAREQFHLFCTNATSAASLELEGFQVIDLNVNEGLLKWKRNAQKQLRRNYFHKNQGLLLEQLSSDKTNIISLEELENATNNFDSTRIIGHGGHGMVYKGILSDQRVVAIKKSKVINYSEIKQFINEVAILSQINHRNIVKLLGCCLESEVPLLVYDYISSGSLSQILHAETRDDFSLSWDDYIRIAMETAGALSYLHSAASISIFHRDVKSSNILLDGNYTAKVSDFGASRLVPVDQTHIVTNIQGTFGYLDPEYFQTRQLNEKSDVYSFGVVLLELLFRKKPIFTSRSGLEQNLASYFLQALREKEITDIVDSQVIEEATKEEISSVASLAEMCLRLRGEERPTMKQVEMELQILRKKRVNSYRSRPENEQQKKITLLTRRGEANCQPSATEVGERVQLEHSQRCYSLEEEVMNSASLPR